jgi:membrane protein DedA with SNARE-associated domain
MGDFILNIMGTYGYIGIFFLIAIENIFPPIPSEVILTFGGFITKSTDLTPVGVILASTIGSLLGAIILYDVGIFVTKFKWFKKSNLDKTNNWFAKYGEKAVLFGRCVPIIRSLISIPAGINHMNMRLFLIYTIVGSLIWNTILVTAGVILADNWSIFAGFISKYSKVILVIITIYIFCKFWQFCIHKRKKVL